MYCNKWEDGAYSHVASSIPFFRIRTHLNWDLSLNKNLFINEIKLRLDSLSQTALDDGRDIGDTKQIRYPNDVFEKF